MLNHQACEDLIAQLRNFAAELLEATEAYQAFPEVINRETDAIRERDVDGMAEIVREKLSVGQNLETKVNAFMECGIQAVNILDRYSVPHEKFEMNVSGVLRVFEEASPHIRGIDEFKGDVFSRLIESADANAATFLESVQKTNRIIEVNKLVTSSLLNSYQESIRFWQDVMSESEATYTAKGTKKSDLNHGVIKVGA